MTLLISISLRNLSLSGLFWTDHTQGRNDTGCDVQTQFFIHKLTSIQSPWWHNGEEPTYPHTVYSLTEDTDRWRGHCKTLCIEREKGDWSRFGTQETFRGRHEVLAEIWRMGEQQGKQRWKSDLRQRKQDRQNWKELGEKQDGMRGITKNGKSGSDSKWTACLYLVSFNK